MTAWPKALALVGLLALAGVASTHGRLWTLPDRYNPSAPLAFDESAGWLTGHKLRRLRDRPAECLSLLATTPLRFEPVADRETGPGCGLRDAVRITRTAVSVGTPFTLSCPAAASLALWERHVLQPEAQARFGVPLARLEHFGSYACRNVYGREEGRRSRHATADALDVAGFVLQGGRRVTVARDWSGDGPEAQFLRAAHAGACTWFDGVLGPDYNAAHADHFHLDRGSFGLCR